MAVGTVSTRILTDIANAIRYQAGVATTYKPREMAAAVSGLATRAGVRSMRYTFSSCAFTTIDFRGFNPSTLTDLFYTFSGCNKLTRIYAGTTWALPSSWITGSQCFYSCSTSLVGGNGTVWASSKTTYTYFRIDTASAPGYITAA